MNCKRMELTKGQLSIWQMEKYTGGSIASICGGILYPLFPEDKIGTMISAAKSLYEINEALRVQLAQDYQQQCIQTVTDNIPTIEKCVFESQEEFERYAENWAREPIPANGMLCLMKVICYPKAAGLLVKMHHIISDAWSLTVLGNQFNTLLHGGIPDAAIQYSEYIANELAYWSGTRSEKDLLYFEELYEKNDSILSLSEEQSTDYSSKRMTYSFGKDLTASIRAYIDQKHFSILPFFLCLYATYFSRTHLNANQMYIGTTVLNRTRRAEKNMVGMLVNSLPVLLKIHGEDSFEQNLNEAQDAVFSVMRRAKCTYSAIIERLRKTYSDLDRLYDVTVNYQNAKINATDEGFHTKWFSNGMQTETLQIHIEDHDDTAQLNVHYDYRTSLMTAAEIDQLHESVLRIIESVIQSCEKPVSYIPILSEKEIKTLTSQSTPSIVPHYSSLADWLRACEQQWSDRICIETREKELTYNELLTLAQRLTGQFANLNISDGDVVALCLRRKWYLPVAFAACCLAGVTFVPIDPDYPKERIRFMLEDSEAKIMMDDELVTHLLNSDLNQAVQSSSIVTNDNAYFIYTSGSTGKPKGVVITQKNLLNNIAWRTAYYHTPNTNVVNVSNLTADTFWEDLTYSIFSGNRFCLVENYRDLSQIAEMVTQHDNVMLMTTPTYFSTIIENIAINNFEQVILVGEHLESTLAEKILNSHVRLYNEYGPSECTICSTVTPITSTDIHIGRPINGVGVCILDNNLQPVPVGVPGELCVYGNGVGIGYLKRADLTEARFVQDPFHEGRMYRTGDIAKWRSDMNICFIGRNDNQCKIRGLRVELDEIERRLSGIENVDKAAVIVRSDSDHHQMICAFYTGKATESDVLRRQLSGFLPQHMIPHVFTHIEEMPLTANDKINKRALLHVEIASEATSTIYQPPKTDVERVLCDLAAGILDITPYGTTHHFFNCGGDSLKAILFVSKARQRGISIDVQSVFIHPTIHELADFFVHGTEVKQKHAEEDWKNYTNILHQLEEKEWIERKMEGPVLLTGATGFLGAHILAELLHTCNDEIWCIVRGRNEIDSKNRLISMLKCYFGDRDLELIARRVHVLNGDLSENRFALSETQYLYLTQTITRTIHAAANVKHYGPYEDFYRGNVLATSNVIDFCRAAQSHLVHISTTSVSGIALDQHHVSPVFTEHDLYFGQDLENVYVRSKFQAEALVLEAMYYGLSACIVRMGNLTNRVQDGVFQHNSGTNAFAKRMATMLDLGFYPETLNGLHVEFTPVDEAAHAVALLAIYVSGKPVFHLMNPHMETLESIARVFTQCGVPLAAIAEQDFNKLLNSETDKAQAARKAFINEIDAEGNLVLTGGVQIDCRETTTWLAKHSFTWKPIDEQYLTQYLHFLEQLMKGEER